MPHHRPVSLPIPPKAGDLLVAGARVLATPEGTRPLAGARSGALRVIDRGAVAARGGVIAWVGAEADLPENLSRLPRLDAGGGTVLPGFVDAHTHAVFAGDREPEFRQRLMGATYAEIAAAGGGILSTVRATRSATADTLLAELTARLDRMLLCGTTTAEVKSGYGLDLETEERQLGVVRDANALHPVDLVPTYMGAHAVPDEHRHDREGYVRLLLEEGIPRIAAARLAEHCDVFCEAGAFTIDESRRILQRARDLGLTLKIHADELTDCGGAGLAAEMGALSAEHLLKASPEGIAALARAGVVAVLLPATSFFLMTAHAPARLFRDAGCAMALGTDLNPGSSHTESLPMAAVLACLGNRMLPEEAIVAMTLNAAAAVGRAARVGSLEPGKAMDVVVIDAPSAGHLVYHFGVNLVRHVVKDGRVVVREGVREVSAHDG